MRTKPVDIKNFLELKSYAIIGASAKEKKFGNIIMSEMLRRGFKVFPVHKSARSIDGIKCYQSLEEIPEKPEGVILVIPPPETEKVVMEIADSGIRNVWMQQGAESKTAINYCESHAIKLIKGRVYADVL